MKKKHLLLPVMLAFALNAVAIRPLHKAFPLTQSDGTTIMVYKNGDGFLAFYTSVDNKVLVRNANGDLCYAKIVDGRLCPTDVVAHEADARSEAENAFLATYSLKPSEAMEAVSENPVASHRIQKALNASTSDGLGQYGKSGNGSVNSIGNITIPVIMVEFADTKFKSTTTKEKMTRFYNQEGYAEEAGCRGSVKDYFKDQSRGMFVPTFDVVAKVTLKNGYAYYGANSAYGNDIRVGSMIKEAVEAAKNLGVDFSKYYVNGKVPLVSVLYAGQGEATGGDENTIWPHESDFNQTLGGYKFASYFVGNELYYDNQLMGMGVFVHEFGHALGFPDFYDPTYSYDNDAPFGFWSVMDAGAYVNNARTPVGYTAYERSFLGWLDIPELADAASVTLSNPNDNDGQMAVMIRNPKNRNEYFILENRQPGTWYPSANGSGLLLTRFSYSSSSWMYNRVNVNQNQKRAMAVTADNSKIDRNVREDHLFGNGMFQIPSFTLFDKTTLTSSPVYKIIKHSGGTITFNYIDRTLPTVAEVNGKKYSKVTDVDALATGDSIIIVCEEDKMAINMIQTSAFRGAVNIEVENGVATGNDDVQVFKLQKTVNGRNWGFVVPAGYLSGGSGKTLKTQKKADANSLAVITITDGNAAITFQGNYGGTIGYTADNINFTCSPAAEKAVQIYRKSDGSGIESLGVDSNGAEDGVYYTVSGQKVTGSLPAGLYIRNGKKIIIKK
ncbi:M6 family metalloprotease domain-containing protein [Xylanibacter muris]|uniref:M6 family metalloprotease domain-containing protein n=1 Tax=Xylanibacter muris TaxID=2736290 RepID=A0ABX2ANW6_9BACT|nr:M6 family metalloprotease domain-containing protein [Xylanibacter muris]NPD91885.1 M6 family metalloprotease domain-containing protein [Xylanibacter muris]